MGPLEFIMGYTHYYGPNKVKGAKAPDLETKYQKAISQCKKVILGYQKDIKAIDTKHAYRLSGYSAYAPRYGGIFINGTKDLAHEDFFMREHFNQNKSEFCKTAHKPYDVVVVACLIILKHYLKDSFNVESDGFRRDWFEGLELAKKHTGLKSLEIPKSIDSRLEVVI